MWLLMLAGTVGFWVLVALTVQALIGGGRPDPTPAPDALAVLRERLARGEISPEDFEHRRRLLTDGHVAPPQDSAPSGREP
jgi:putative membrane protein